MDTRADLVLAVFVAIFGLGVVAVALTIPDGLYRDAVGPRLVPIGVGLGLFGCGAALALRRTLRMEAALGFTAPEEGTADEPGHPASLRRALLVMALTLAYATAFKPLGYPIATPLYVASALWAMGERQAIKVALIASIWTVVTYVLFAQILGVRMPVGPFRQVFRDLGLIML